jgi:hypothetical protein
MQILKIAGTAIGAILVLGFLYLSFADFGNYKPEIEAAVADATGREFRINGDLEIRPLLSPSVRMQDVTLANAPWANEPNMVEIGAMAVEIDLWSLLSGPVVVKDFQLHDVNVRLETNEDGQSNTDFDVPEAEPAVEEAAAPASAEPPLILRNADISNVKFTVQQPGSDDINLALESLTVVTDEAGQQVIVGAGSLLERALTLDGVVREQQADINATFGTIRYHSLTRHRGAEADVDITISRLTDVGEVLEITNLPAEDLTLSGNIALRGDSLWLSDVTFGVANAALVINGELDGATSEARLELSANAPSLAALGAGLPNMPMTGSASVVLAQNALQMDPFEFRFGESDLAGMLSIAGGDATEITLQASSSLIDLRPFSADEEAGESAEIEQAASAEDESPYMFGEQPLPLDALRALNTDIDITIDRIQGRSSHINDVSLIVDASDGAITLDAAFKDDRSGSFENHVELQASESVADLSVTALASELRLGMFTGEELADEFAPATDLSLDITASGASPRQLAASTNGRVLFTQGSGRMKNELIGRLSGDLLAQLFSALNPFAKDEEFSNWDCSIFAIDFVSGEGEITGFLLQGEKIMVVGGGEIDLNTEKLGIEFNTKPRSGVGVSADMFVTPFVALSGTLKEPGVGLNASGVLLEGGMAVMTGGLSFLYKGLMDRATAEVDQCENTLAEVTEAVSR